MAPALPPSHPPRPPTYPPSRTPTVMPTHVSVKKGTLPASLDDDTWESEENAKQLANKSKRKNKNRNKNRRKRKPKKSAAVGHKKRLTHKTQTRSQAEAVDDDVLWGPVKASEPVIVRPPMEQKQLQALKLRQQQAYMMERAFERRGAGSPKR